VGNDPVIGLWVGTGNLAQVSNTYFHRIVDGYHSICTGGNLLVGIGTLDVSVGSNVFLKKPVLFTGLFKFHIDPVGISQENMGIGRGVLLLQRSFLVFVRY